jgi:hypothetical protein
MNPVLRREFTPHGPDVERPKVSDAGRRWWDRNRAGIRSGWRDCHAWLELSREDRLLIEERIKHGLGHPDPDIRERMQSMVETVTMAELVDVGGPASDHLKAEVTAAHWKGRRDGTPIPLDPGVPVPGCTCPGCTGVAADAPVRQTTRPRRDLRPALDVDRARAVPILDVAAMLGIEHKRGWAVCPFHADSSPSLHLNAKKQAAFCNPCGKSWDAIALVMDYKRIPFVDAVKELAA